MNDIPLVLLIIFSAFSMNLVLQCALGIRGAAEAVNYFRVSTFIKLGIIFSSVILLWVVFSKIISSVISGIFIYVLLFPVSLMAYEGFEFLIFRRALKKDPEKGNAISFPGGITAAAVFICLTIADSFLEAAALSFGFAAGILLVFLIIGEIRRRAALEAVPYYLRGKPLVLISMGMLSLIFSTASLLLFRMIGAR
jgi:electron transport complex protein RnfA